MAHVSDNGQVRKKSHVSMCSENRKLSNWSSPPTKRGLEVKKTGKFRRFRQAIRGGWYGLKSLFSRSSGDIVELRTLTVPRALPLSPFDMYLCDQCLEATGRGSKGRRSLPPTRICFRSINIGNDSPIYLRELVPCERCTPPEDLRYHRFEASSDEISKVQKKMSMLPKDVDWLQEFARIEVEKTKGKCTIRSNKQI